MPLPRPAPGTTRWWVVGTVGCLAAVAFIIWWGITTTVGSVRPEVTAYEVQSDSMVLVEYDLHRPQGVAVVCQVVGLDNNKGRVGAVEDRVPASGPASVHRVVSVRTSARAVTGVVDSCTRQPPAP
ncbi:MAG: DUF4307 domain-containing protein [Ornithinibacter sp.]